MLAGQRDFEQGIILKIVLANGEIVCGAPVGIHPIEKSRRKRAADVAISANVAVRDDPVLRNVPAPSDSTSKLMLLANECSTHP
jgi:hypothetical protein